MWPEAADGRNFISGDGDEIKDEDQKFGLGPVNFEVPIRYPHGNVK